MNFNSMQWLDPNAPACMDMSLFLNTSSETSSVD